MKTEKELLATAITSGWDYISQFEVLTMEFIEKYCNKINWKMLSYNKSYDEIFIKKYFDKLDIDLICRFQKLSEEFIREFYKKLNPSIMQQYQKLPQDLIINNRPDFDIFMLCTFQNLTEDFIEGNIWSFNEMCWDMISKYQILSEYFIAKYIDVLNWSSIIECQNLTEKFILNNSKKFNKNWIYKKKEIKVKSRVFNFNLPDDLRDYLKNKSIENKSTISQNIINLILEDKNKKIYN